MADDIKVLAVDDSSVVRAMMGVIFTAAGCRIETASGVRDGLRTLRRFEPHVILTDYNMPGLDGHAFVRLVRRNERLQHIPILVISSEDDPAKHAAMARAGVDAWFPKPIDAARILTAVQALTMPSALVLPFPKLAPPSAETLRPDQMFDRYIKVLKSAIGGRGYSALD